MVVLLIPIWGKMVVPFLSKLGINIRPLLSVFLGGLCAAFSFALAGILQIYIDNSDVSIKFVND